MSSDKAGENPPHRKPKVSWEGKSAQGESGPKARPKGVVDGQQVNIPVPLTCVLPMEGRRRTERSAATGNVVRYKRVLKDDRQILGFMNLRGDVEPH